MRSFLPFLVSLGVVAGARADDYSWELSGFASQADLDPILETDQSTISATYHFAAVDDSKGPLALASFLDPETRIAASITRDRQRAQIISPPGALLFPDIVSESDTYSVSGRYALPAKKWYAGGRYAQGNRGIAPGSLITDADMSGATIFAGRYFGAATSLELSLDRVVDETQGTGIACVGNPLFGCAAIVPQSTRQTRDTASLSVLHLRRFRSLTYTLAGSVADSSGQAIIHSGSFQLPVPLPSLPPGLVIVGPLPVITVPARTTELGLDRFLVYSVAGELFPTRKVGVRLGYVHWGGSSTVDYAYDIAATWFVSRNVGLRFAFGRQHAQASFGDTDVASLQATGRF